MIAAPFLLPGLLVIGVLLSTCQFSAPEEAAKVDAMQWSESVEQRLPGTWLREQTQQDIKARRILRLEPDGAFQERVRVVDAAGQASEFVHAGTWIYDGINLKRKYTMMNGKPPSRLNLPFATFEIAFDGRDDFVGTDHIRGHKVRYRRVAPETEP